MPNINEQLFFEKVAGNTKLKVVEVAHKPVTHDVKSWMHFFQAIKAGTKLHDLRKNDRNYSVGDILLLREYDFVHGCYTGNSLEAEITYITSNKVPCAFSSAVLDPGYCILSLRVRK